MPRTRVEAAAEGGEKGWKKAGSDRSKLSSSNSSTGLTRVRVSKLQRQEPVDKVKKVVVNMHRKDADGGVFRKRRVLEEIGNMKVVPDHDSKRQKNEVKPGTSGELKKGTSGGEKTKEPHVVARINKEKKSMKIFPKKKTCPDIPLPVPLKLEAQESLKLEKLTVAIDNVQLVKLPEGVQDIDKDDTNAFCNPQYARDIIEYLHEQEHLYRLGSNFLSKQQDVDANMRAILIDWLIQVQNHLAISAETLHLSVTLLDRFLILQKIQLAKLQLLGITCLLVAAKFEERYPPTIKKLIHLTDNTYAYNDVIRMERLMLMVLDYQINLPTSMAFLDRYWKAMGPATPKVLDVCCYLLDLTLPDLHIVRFTPSMRAAGALCLAAKIILPAEEGGPSTAENLWTPALKHYSYMSESQLVPCMHRMARALVKAEKSKFQGAYEKYGSRSMYGAVSNWPLLTTCDAVKELSTKELSTKSG